MEVEKEKEKETAIKSSFHQEKNSVSKKRKHQETLNIDKEAEVVEEEDDDDNNDLRQLLLLSEEVRLQQKELILKHIDRGIDKEEIGNQKGNYDSPGISTNDFEKADNDQRKIDFILQGLSASEQLQQMQLLRFEIIEDAYKVLLHWSEKEDQISSINHLLQDGSKSLHQSNSLEIFLNEETTETSSNMKRNKLQAGETTKLTDLLLTNDATREGGENRDDDNVEEEEEDKLTLYLSQRCGDIILSQQHMQQSQNRSYKNDSGYSKEVSTFMALNSQQISISNLSQPFNSQMENSLPLYKGSFDIQFSMEETDQISRCDSKSKSRSYRRRDEELEITSLTKSEPSLPYLGKKDKSRDIDKDMQSELITSGFYSTQQTQSIIPERKDENSKRSHTLTREESINKQNGQESQVSFSSSWCSNSLDFQGLGQEQQDYSTASASANYMGKYNERFPNLRMQASPMSILRELQYLHSSSSFSMSNLTLKGTNGSPMIWTIRNVSHLPAISNCNVGRIVNDLRVLKEKFVSISSSKKRKELKGMDNINDSKIERKEAQQSYKSLLYDTAIKTLRSTKPTLTDKLITIENHRQEKEKEVMTNKGPNMPWLNPKRSVFDESHWEQKGLDRGERFIGISDYIQSKFNFHDF